MSSSYWTEILLILNLSFVCLLSSATQVDYDANAIIINGERRVIFSGAIHYPRSTSQMWPDLIRKAKDGGLDAIETYIFWNAHEPQRHQYDFSGNLDFIKFFKLVQEAGLYAIIRIGPYLHNIPGIQLRTNNEIYKNEMQIFITKIVNMCKEANLFAPQGGPIILAQIENEYGNIMGPYKEAGKSYINWCAQMATSQNIGINTCNGFYCDEFVPNNPKSPKMWTENWTGWTPQDVSFAVARFFQAGGVLQNYYMYHGGTNFGRDAGGPFIITSYDYDAPLDEYGNLNQPKWGHLKQLHEAIKLGEKILTSGNVTTKQFGNGVNLTTYSNTTSGERFCFLSNTNTSQDANVDLQQDGKYFVPAWSVSILHGCNKEVYNTAKVNTETTVMVKKPIELGTKLSWMWAQETIRDTLHGKGRFNATKLIEQKEATSDESDYLWYMTSIENMGKSSHNATLYVKSSGQVLHAYVNSKHIGSQFGYDFEFKQPAILRPGKNFLTLLSATVGLQNYGEFFDLGPEGLAGGPVELNVDGMASLNLSSNIWNYKVGLNGEAKRLYDPNSPHAHIWKTSKKLPIGKPMKWYKTSFKIPPGTSPVVVDLQGMGKGHAWVNGNSLGRYWPSQIADTNGCSDTCDYRGEYKPEKCVTNCGNPSQRWYHVPRSFLNDGTNTLILFEEMGGNPSHVSFQTVVAAAAIPAHLLTYADILSGLNIIFLVIGWPNIKAQWKTRPILN
ncbi:Beta-galactosidase 7 [Citrus sinensis]|uniref:Beta-galactosidase 7 n=1 Tax=Citrus sinensis TaxID=2711 RepID=A0ACB8KEN8_CITSI|nr:Beta-galactosidase 7 [Citrus sinensis]